MRQFIIFVVCFTLGSIVGSMFHRAFGQTVHGYTVKKSGRSVSPYERSVPDKVKENNLGYKYGRSRR